MGRSSVALAITVALASQRAVSSQDTPKWFLTGEEVELVEVLNTCASGLGISLDYDKALVQGKVTIRAEAGMDGEALWLLTNRLLASKKLASIQAPGESALGIVPIDQAAKLARIEQNPEEAQAGFVKTMRGLHYAEPDKTAEMLKQVLAAEGSVVQAMPSARQLLIAGPKPQVLEALHALDLLDSAEPPAIEFFPVHNASPTAVATILERVEKAIEQVTKHTPEGVALVDVASGSILVVAPEPEMLWWKEQIERFDRVQPAVTRNYAPRRFSLKETAKLVQDVVHGTEEGWHLVEDDLTGTLVITASPSQHEAIEALLDRLETSAPDARLAMRVFPIRHRDVDEFLGLLESLLRGTPLPATTTREDAGGQTPTDRSALPAPPSTVGGRPVPEASDLSLSKDPGTNRILAVGPPRLLDELGRLIEQLDVQHPQVLVETLIVTLNESQTKDLAVEFQKIGTTNGALWRLASLFGAGSPDPNGSLPAAGGTGLESVILDQGSFSGVLRALETVNDGRALTVPKVLVNNNETAHLDSLLQSPYATSNTSTNLATISFGGTLDAGTTISVTPQITDGDQILMEYTVSLSTFVGSSTDPTLPPPRQENKLGSVATVPDGYTVVIGGLEIESETDGRSRVPILGSIPILGNLFQSQSKTRTKSRFFVFLRCSVLRSATFEDLRYLSAPALAAAGVDDGMPVVQPRVIR